MLRKFLTGKRGRADARCRTVQPGLELLEDRLVPAGVIQLASKTGVLSITGTAANDTAVVRILNQGTAIVVDDKVEVRLAHSGHTQVQSFNRTSVTKIKFMGDSGNDTFVNSTPIPCEARGNGGKDILIGGSGNDIVYGGDGNDLIKGGGGVDHLEGNANDDAMYGQSGADVMLGGSGHDRMYGGAGNDTMHGGEGNDKMYGNAGVDLLLGEDNNDFLDGGGQTNDVVDGGSGLDFDARNWAIGGTAASDVKQLMSGTCWVLAPLAAAAGQNEPLASRITYQGDGVYNVKLFEDSWGTIVSHSIVVHFDGDYSAFDAQPHAVQEGDFWALLMHRAYVQWQGQTLESIGGGVPDTSLTAFTGRRDDSRYPPFFKDVFGGPGHPDHIRQLLADGKSVVACTWPWAGDMVDSHCYYVRGITEDSSGNWTVKVYNPWGADTDVDHPNVATTGSDDGFVTLTWDQFAASVASYWFA